MTSGTRPYLFLFLIFFMLTGIAVTDLFSSPSNITAKSKTATSVFPDVGKRPPIRALHVNFKPGLLFKMRQPNGRIPAFRIDIWRAPGIEAVVQSLAHEFSMGSRESIRQHQAMPVGRCRVHRIDQLFDGIPVKGGRLSLAECAGKVIGGSGGWAPDLDLDTTGKLNYAEAQSRALETAQRQLGVQEIKVGETIRGRKLIWPNKKGSKIEYRLAYRFDLPLAIPFGGYRAVIDATDGRLLHWEETSAHAWNEVTMAGQAHYTGAVSFVGQHDPDVGRYRLESDGLLPATVRDGQGLPTPVGDLVIFDDDPDFSEAEYHKPVAAYWAAQGTLDYWLQNFAYPGLDGGGEKTKIVMDVIYPNLSINDAAWVTPWELIIVNSGDGITNGPQVHPETIAHEMTHAVLYFRIGDLDGLNGNNDSKALGESYSDIFGIIVEGVLRNDPVDWYFGDQWNLDGYTRRFDNPALSNPAQPTVYLEPGKWHPTDYYLNNGVHNHGFYLLSVGKPNSITGIGIEAAARIAFHAIISDLLQPDSTHPEAALVEALVAEMLYGTHTQPVASVLEVAKEQKILANAYQNTLFYTPADGAIDVPPWPAELTWQALADEVEWQIEISFDQDFNSIEKNRYWNGAPDSSPLQLVSLPQGESPSLRPGKTYFWRVRGRATGQSEWQAWRVPVSFTADERRVTPLEPWTEVQPMYHPWDLEFSWEAVDGAAFYEIAAALKPANGVVDWDNGVLWGPHEIFKTKTTKHTKVNSQQLWRIRAVGPDDTADNYGSWTEVPFRTLIPQVELIAPKNLEKRYPWPTTLRWHSVIGAHEYILNLTDCDGVFFTEQQQIPCEPTPHLNYDPVKVPANPDKSEMDFDINVPPAWSFKNVIYWWKAEVVGPAPWFEKGGPSIPDKAKWVVDGDDTIPQTLVPAFSLFDSPCLPFDKSVQFEWASVKNATAYELVVKELLASNPPPASFTLKTGNNVTAVSLPATSSGTQQTSLSGVAGPINSKLHLGFWFHVSSVGPDGIPGLEDHTGTSYYVERTQPQPITPNDKTFALGETVALEWETQNAPFGEFSGQLFSGKGCHAGSFEDSVTVPGKASGGSFMTVSDWQKGDIYSWRVTPKWNIDNSQCPSGPIWSQCRWFKAPAPVCGDGKVEGNEDCDDGNAINGDGCSDSCVPDLACDTVLDAGGKDKGYRNKPLFVGSNQGTIWFQVDTVNIPDRIWVTYNGTTIFDTGCNGTAFSDSYTIGGASKHVNINVEPNCHGNKQDPTLWAFLISCVDGNSEPPDAGTEP